MLAQGLGRREASARRVRLVVEDRDAAVRVRDPEVDRALDEQRVEARHLGPLREPDAGVEGDLRDGPLASPPARPGRHGPSATRGSERPWRAPGRARPRGRRPGNSSPTASATRRGRSPTPGSDLRARDAPRARAPRGRSRRSPPGPRPSARPERRPRRRRRGPPRPRRTRPRARAGVAAPVRRRRRRRRARRRSRPASARTRAGRRSSRRTASGPDAGTGARTRAQAASAPARSASTAGVAPSTQPVRAVRDEPGRVADRAPRRGRLLDAHHDGRRLGPTRGGPDRGGRPQLVPDLPSPPDEPARLALGRFGRRRSP